jgi:hypothetical protein
LAAALKQEPDTEVEVIDGQKGELTVLVDGREVIQKGDSFPSVDEVKAAVEGAPAGT